MFESLSTRLQDVFKTLRGGAKLTEASVDAALREIRLALLEADVQLPRRQSLRRFAWRAKAVGESVLRSLTPAQQVVRIVRDEMLRLFGTPRAACPTRQTPRVVLMLGLQGRARRRRRRSWRDGCKQGRHPMLVSTDVRRPAAIKQLSVLAEQSGVRVHDPAGEMDPVRASGLVRSPATRNLGFDTLIVDTAGRLHIDDELMGELDAIKAAVRAVRLAVRRRRDDRAGRGQERRRVSSPRRARLAWC
jgi:signal recognition particle subunit SRP54